MKLRYVVAAILLTGITAAWAQTAVVTGNEFQTATPGKTVSGVVTMCINGSNQAAPCSTGGGSSDVNITGINGATPSATNPIWVAPASSTAFPVLAAPRTALTVSGCTVGTSSASCIAASTANVWVQVQNTSASAQIACSWGGTAALNASGSFMLQPGQSATWGVLSSGVPTNALNCIASGASTPLYVEYR